MCCCKFVFAAPKIHYVTNMITMNGDFAVHRFRYSQSKNSSAT